MNEMWTVALSFSLKSPPLHRSLTNTWAPLLGSALRSSSFFTGACMAETQSVHHWDHLRAQLLDNSFLCSQHINTSISRAPFSWLALYKEKKTYLYIVARIVIWSNEIIKEYILLLFINMQKRKKKTWGSNTRHWNKTLVVSYKNILKY